MVSMEMEMNYDVICMTSLRKVIFNFVFLTMISLGLFSGYISPSQKMERKES